MDVIYNRPFWAAYSSMKLFLVFRAALLGVEVAEIFSPGRQSAKVKARSLVCYWAARGLGMSLSDLARAFAISIPGISYAVG